MLLSFAGGHVQQGCPGPPHPLNGRGAQQAVVREAHTGERRSIRPPGDVYAGSQIGGTLSQAKKQVKRPFKRRKTMTRAVERILHVAALAAFLLTFSQTAPAQAVRTGFSVAGTQERADDHYSRPPCNRMPHQLLRQHIHPPLRRDQRLRHLRFGTDRLHAGEPDQQSPENHRAFLRRCGYQQFAIRLDHLGLRHGERQAGLCGDLERCRLF